MDGAFNASRMAEPVAYFSAMLARPTPTKYAQSGPRAMAAAWSAPVLVLIVQLFEFRDVAGNMRPVRHILLLPAVIGGRLPPHSDVCHDSPRQNPRDTPRRF